MTKYGEWLSNVVLVLKNGKLRICIDFRNLNSAMPKDEYHMPITNLLVNGVAGYKFLSFMDGHSSYNKIFIAEKDMQKTSFRCSGAIGTFEWLVMSFRLRNTRATYQRAMNLIFHDMIGKFLEIYINDVVIKFHDFNKHLEDLERGFICMCKHQLKMNPLKCAFGISVGNFLGFLIHQRGIKVD